jgi:hypothetical protein
MKEFYTANEAKLIKFAKNVNYDFIRTNGVCVAKTNHDDVCYFRVQVKEIKKHFEADNTITLFCFDSGVFCEINYTDLFPITEEFMEYSQYCIFCKLDLVAPKENEWSQDAIKHFRNALNKDSKLYYARVLNQQANSIVECKINDPLQVALYDIKAKTHDNQLNNLVPLNEELIEKGFAVHSYTKEDPNNEVFESVSVHNAKQSFNNKENETKNTTQLPDQENVQEFKTAWIQKFLMDQQIEIKNRSIYEFLYFRAILRKFYVFCWNLNFFLFFQKIIQCWN